MNDEVAEYLKSNLDSAITNRAVMERKWEDNRRHFLGYMTHQWKHEEGEDWRSRATPRVVHQKIVSALAVTIDTVLGAGEVPFMLKPSGFEKNRVRTSGPIDPAAVMRAIQDQTDLMRQQLSDCKAEVQYSRNALSAILYGITYGKFHTFSMTREGWEPSNPEVPGILDWKRLPSTAQQWRKWSETFMAPGYQCVSIWDIYRDWETNNLYECAYIGHRQFISSWWLRQKKGQPYFIDKAIEEALTKLTTTSGARTSPSVNNDNDVQAQAPIQREIQLRVTDQKYFEYWGRIPRKVVEGFEKRLKDENGGDFQLPNVSGESDQGDEIECNACSYNDSATVRFVRTKNSMRPFVQGIWEDPGDELCPHGVADNCREMANVLAGTFRAIEDNVKLSANVILALKRELIKSMSKHIKPGMEIDLHAECAKASDAIQSVVIPNVTGPLMQLLDVLVKFLDDDSMVPKIAQGVREPGDQTAFEANIRQAASSKYLGMGIRNLDSGIIEPIIQKFYDYNMNDQTLQVGKGNFIVQALGFTSFQNKSERIRHIQMILAMALQDPRLGGMANFRAIVEQITKAVDEDPDQFWLPEAMVQQNAQAQAASPEAQAAAAAQKAALEKTQAETVAKRAQAVKALADAEEKENAVALTKTVPGAEPSLATEAPNGNVGTGEAESTGGGGGEPGGAGPTLGDQGAV